VSEAWAGQVGMLALTAWMLQYRITGRVARQML